MDRAAQNPGLASVIRTKKAALGGDINDGISKSDVVSTYA